MIFENIIFKIKKKDTPVSRLLFSVLSFIRQFHFPFPEFFGSIYYYERQIRITAWRFLKQFFYYEPMFRYRCKKVGKGLVLESNFPRIAGYGSLFVGDQVTIGKDVNFTMSYKVNKNPSIFIGNKVYVGFRSVFSCADNIHIGNRVLIAGGVQVYDNNNHPIDPQLRAENAPVEKENVKPVSIEDDVWIGFGSIILKGVTIGKGSIVAIGSIVTKDVPPNVIVAGNPAVIVKHM